MHLYVVILEDVSMKALSGLDKNKVCSLKKILYGLKYPRAWFGRFAKVMFKKYK